MEPLCNRKRIQTIKDASKRQKIMDILSCLVLNDEAIQRIMSTLEEQISYSNSRDESERKKSDLFWECTYVRGLLEGNENGNYLGLDLGSTNFRVVLVSFKDGKAETTTKYYNLPEDLLSGTADGVFDHIAGSIEAFLQEETLDKTVNIPLGFSFSFPTVQKSLKNSIIMTWTKSFKCTTGPGLDPVTLLEEAIKRRGGLSAPVNIIARISDTTGTLMAGNYVDKNCRIGLILGSGSNACFVERVENFNKLESDDGTSDKVLVNCEWGAFGDNGCLDFMKTEYDKDMDQHSNHAGSYTFEKLFSGYFLGELVRLVLVKLTSHGLLFNGKETEDLKRRWNFKTSYVTNIERNDSEGTKEILKELKLDNLASDEDITVIQEVASIVSERGAYIVSAALAVLLNHINLPEVTIAVDGSLYEHHPKYHSHMMQLLTSLVPKTKTKIILTKNGSGQGSAFVAAVGSKKS